jgi:hypothetical protein
MKTLILFSITLILCCNISAQEFPKTSNVFVRVYNEYGKKIAKGKITNIKDNSLILAKGSKSITVPLNEIDFIKTKRTNGHNVLIGSLVGFTIPMVGLAQSDGVWDALGFIVLTPLVTAFGSGIGFLTTLFKNSEHYAIDQNPLKWQGFKEAMLAPNR